MKRDELLKSVFASCIYETILEDESSKEEYGENDIQDTVNMATENLFKSMKEELDAFGSCSDEQFFKVALYACMMRGLIEKSSGNEMMAKLYSRLVRDVDMLRSKNIIVTGAKA